MERSPKQNTLSVNGTKSYAKPAFQVNQKDGWYAVLFLGPSLLLLTVFVFYPMLKTLYLSLFITNSLGQPKIFVGLKNYISLFTSSAYLASVRATFIYVLFVCALTIVLGLLLAQTATAKLRGIGFFSNDGGFGFGCRDLLAVYL